MDKEINNKLIEIFQLKELARNISAVNNDGERVMKTKNPDKIGDAVAEIVDMENEVRIATKRLLETKRKVIGQIESLDNTVYYDILFLLYVKNSSYRELEKEMNYSRSQLWRIHNDALAEFERKYGSEYLET